jgi:hypothetical protein
MVGPRWVWAAAAAASAVSAVVGLALARGAAKAEHTTIAPVPAAPL